VSELVAEEIHVSTIGQRRSADDDAHEGMDKMSPLLESICTSLGGVCGHRSRLI
jgi:hypothetical protein